MNSPRSKVERDNSSLSSQAHRTSAQTASTESNTAERRLHPTVHSPCASKAKNQHFEHKSLHKKRRIQLGLNQTKVTTLSEPAAGYNHNVCDTDSAWGESLQLQLLDTSVSRYNFQKHVLFVLLISSELKLLSCHFPKIGKLI